MTRTAIGLVLLSALIHAVWNLLSKASGDRWAFFFAQGLCMVVLYAPALAWLLTPISAAGVLWIVLSALTHAGYAIYLLKAYDAGDLSVAYPLSRTAPVLLVGWDVLTMRAHVHAAGIAGALCAGLGAVTLQWPALRARGGRAVLRDRVTAYALLTSGFIALFTIIDQQGVRQVHPFVFLYLVGCGEFIAIGIRVRRDIRRRLRAELRRNPRAIVFTAVAGPISYLLILWVLGNTPTSYVLGLRQMSIVFGVLLGRVILHEPHARYRLTGAAVIAAGSVLIAAGG